MALPPSESTLPADGDIIVLTDASVNQKSYVLGIAPNPGQLRYGSFQEAMSVASRWALSRGVAIWFSEDRGTFSIVHRKSRERAMPKEQLDVLVCRVEGEYLEMPGLQLTRDQAQRLWAIDQAACTLVLDALIERRFLVRGPDNRYRRASDGPLPVGPLRQARAALPLPIPARRLG